MNNKGRFYILGWAALLTCMGLYAIDPESTSGRAVNFLALASFTASLVSKGSK